MPQYRLNPSFESRNFFVSRQEATTKMWKMMQIATSVNATLLQVLKGNGSTEQTRKSGIFLKESYTYFLIVWKMATFKVQRTLYLYVIDCVFAYTLKTNFKLRKSTAGPVILNKYFTFWEN